jgi:hypothetical protein
MWISPKRVLRVSSIPGAIGLVGAGLALEPSHASIYLYIASVLCAGATVVRFIVKELSPEDGYASDRLAPDEQPEIPTTRPIAAYPFERQPEASRLRST